MGGAGGSRSRLNVQSSRGARGARGARGVRGTCGDAGQRFPCIFAVGQFLPELNIYYYIV